MLTVGVFARDVIPPRTCFGPMVGQHCSNVDLSDWPEKDTPQVWKVCALASVGLRLSLSVQNYVKLMKLMSHCVSVADVSQQCAGVLHRDDR